jgi:integrase
LTLFEGYSSFTTQKSGFYYTDCVSSYQQPAKHLKRWFTIPYAIFPKSQNHHFSHMARPLATTAAIQPKHRPETSTISVQWFFRKCKWQTPILAYNVAAEHVGGKGYVKNTHVDYITINNAIEAAVDCLEQATAILVKTGEISNEAIKTEYLRLSAESIEAGVAAEAVAKRQANKKEQRRKIQTVVIEPSLTDEIAELEALVEAKKRERDNVRKELNIYIDDTLVHFLNQYLFDNKNDLAESTQRTYSAFITTVNRFAPTTKIQDVNEQWFKDFEYWLTNTPALRPVYKMRLNPTTKKLERGEIIRYDETGVRTNGTVSNYVTKIKSVLKYYRLRSEQLPADCVITEKYKLYTFKKPINDESVIALEEDELYQLFKFNKFERETHRVATEMFLFLCATSLRVSDLHRITPDVIKDGNIVLKPIKTVKRMITVRIPINQISAYVLKKHNFDLRRKDANGKPIVFHDKKGNEVYKPMVEDYLINERIKLVLNYKHGANFVFPSLQKHDKLVRYSGTTEIEKKSKKNKAGDNVLNTRADLISSHSGRRTYINLALDANVPVNKLMLITGHLKLETLMVYADKRKDVKKHVLNLFNFAKYDPQDYTIPTLIDETVEDAVVVA